MRINRQMCLRPEPLACFAPFCLSPFGRGKGVGVLRFRGEGDRRECLQEANKHERHLVVSKL